MSITAENAHIDANLSNVAMGFSPDIGLIGDVLAPVVPVPKQSDYMPIWNKEDLYRRHVGRRAPATEAQVVTFGVSSVRFHCDNYAFKGRIPDEVRANADLPRIFEGETKRVTTQLLLAKETRIAALLASANVYSQTAVGSAWGTDACDALTDVMNVIDGHQDAVGIRPNRILFGQAAWNTFRKSLQVREAVFPPGKGVGIATRESVREVLEMESLLVGGGYANLAPEGISTMSLVNIFGPNVLVWYAPTAPSQDVPSWMYTFRWNVAELPRPVMVHAHDDKIHAQEIEIGEYTDEKVTDSSLAYLMIGVNSSTAGAP